MPVSFYTPTSAGTVPQANIGTSLIPQLGQGLLQAFQTYQNVKAVDKAATEASTLFSDPTYGNIFRQMGLAAVRNGESPTPIINSMLSTAITLKRDEQNAARQERMASLNFGRSMAMDNLRTANDMSLIDARSSAMAERDAQAPTREYETAMMRKKAEADFETSAEGIALQQTEDERSNAETQRRGATAYQQERGRLLAREDMGLPTDAGSSALGSLFEDAGIDPEEPLTGKTKEDLEALEMDVLTIGESSAEARQQLAPRLRAIREAKENAPRTRKGPNVSTRANERYTP